jgi:hypothetical protein
MNTSLIALSFFVMTAAATAGANPDCVKLAGTYAAPIKMNEYITYDTTLVIEQKDCSQVTITETQKQKGMPATTSLNVYVTRPEALVSRDSAEMDFTFYRYAVINKDTLVAHELMFDHDSPTKINSHTTIFSLDAKGDLVWGVMNAAFENNERFYRLSHTLKRTK